MNVLFVGDEHFEWLSAVTFWGKEQIDQCVRDNWRITDAGYVSEMGVSLGEKWFKIG